MVSTARSVILYEATRRFVNQNGVLMATFTVPLDPAKEIELVFGLRNRHSQPPRFVWTLVPATGDENPALARQGYPTAPYFEWRVEALFSRRWGSPRGDYEQIRPGETNEPISATVEPEGVPIPTRPVIENGAPGISWFRIPMVGAASLFYQGDSLMYEFVPVQLLYYADASFLRGYDAVRVYLRIPQQHGNPLVERPFTQAMLRVIAR